MVGNVMAGGDTERERLRALARSAAEGFRSLSMSASGGSNDNVGGVTCWYSASYVPVFNGAAILEPEQINAGTLDAVENYFKWRGRPYSVMCLDTLVPHAEGLFARYGYAAYDTMPAMWLDGAPMDDPPGSADLAVSRIATPGPLATFRAILSEVFRLSMTEVNLVLSERALSVPHTRHYLGTVHGAAVATATLVLSDGVAGVWNVGTMPAYRHRGIAAAMMRYILAEARAMGYSSSMLLASDDGTPLYRRLGYRALGMVQVFVPTR
ncbi:MAG TPA: GNAT family N-acetyltransferase [Chloroflexia bacterium]|nr:GNAT family N-acetyltransferase [Chloroflexia bacterium]